MSVFHRIASEPVTVRVKTKDRGEVILDLEDSVQFPLYYNIYEWLDTASIVSLLDGTRGVIDVGANVGQLTLLFAKYAEHVYSFEPIPKKIKRLREQITINDLERKVSTFEIALSDSTGTIPFEMPPADNNGLGSSIFTNQYHSGSITVPTTTLDELMKKEDWGPIDLIKLDIEGSELFALRGMVEVIQRDSPILIVEMNAKMMQLGGYSEADLLNFLATYGYSCYAFTRRGLRGPMKQVRASVENYCFLRSEHLKLEKVSRLVV